MTSKILDEKAIDTDSREIVGAYIGSRDKEGAQVARILCQQCSKSVQFVTRIFGKPIKQFFQKNVIGQLGKKPDKHFSKKDSIIH
jgi:hypothetical protein